MPPYLLLAFALCPRPGELLALTPERLIQPRPDAGRYAKHWPILLAPSDSLVAGKTGEFDETLRLDWDELDWLHPVLLMLSRRQRGKSVWPFNAKEVRTMFADAAKDTLTSVLAATPYSLRHGGASHDALTGRRPLGEIKKKGRWRSDASVRRYENSALALAELAKIPEQTHAYSKLVQTHLSAIILNQRPAPRPPALLPRRPD